MSAAEALTAVHRYIEAFNAGDRACVVFPAAMRCRGQRAPVIRMGALSTVAPRRLGQDRAWTKGPPER